MTEKKKIPTWMRLTMGISIGIGGCALSVYATFWMHDLYNSIHFENSWVFGHLWGKLLILFLSGLSVMCWFGFVGIIAIIAAYVALGKKKFFGNIDYDAEFEIMPFPSVFDTDELRYKKMERIDDEFLIFDYGRPATKFGIIVGLIAALPVAILIYSEMDDPYSDSYRYGIPGMMMSFLLISLYAAIAPSRRFVLDRMNGTITFPRHMFFSRRTVPFSKVMVGKRYSRLAFIHPCSNLGIPTVFEHTKGWWCFLILYMDKNRPLPQGTVFTPYREKDFLRRKAEGFPKPLHPNSSLVTDAYMGYIYGTDEFKERLAKMKHDMIYCYTRVSWYCQDNNIKYDNPNELVLIGIWKRQYVFKLFAPENVEYIIIPDNTVLTDCFLCDGYTAEVKHIK